MIKGLIAPALLALASGCAQQSYHPVPEFTTLSQVIAATVSAVREGVSKGAQSPFPPVGLPMCGIEQTWTIGSSGSSLKSLTAGVAGIPDIPLTVSGTASSGATNSNTNVVKLTWTNPLCGGSGSGGAEGGSTGANGKPAGGRGGSPSTYPIAARPEDCPRGSVPECINRVNAHGEGPVICLPNNLLIDRNFPPDSFDINQ